MKLKIRYDDRYQTIEISEADKDKLWVSLSLEGEGLSPEEKERKIQDEFEKQFNLPEYNNWHRHNRHIGKSKAKPGKDENEDDVDYSEPLMDEVSDDRIFRQDEIELDRKFSEEEWCKRIRSAMKPDYAEMIIAVHLDGMSVVEYAKKIGDTRTNVSHRLQRAEKVFREIFPKTSLL